jgi:acyl dehydratase
MPQAVVPLIRWEDLWEGWGFPEFYWAVTPSEIKLFSKIIEAPEPFYFDEEEAKKVGFETIIAHGGYINLFHFEKILLITFNTNPVYPTLHNRSNVEFFKPIYPGDILTIKACVDKKIVSSKGRHFAAFRIEIYNQNRELVARKIHSSLWLTEWAGTKSGPRPLY